jgi:hypothetical protein
VTSKELENLAKTGKLRAESGDRQELDGLLKSARARLSDAKIEALSVPSAHAGAGPGSVAGAVTVP